MSNPLANNFVSSPLGQKHYLSVTKDGIPLQGQVPFVNDTYSGAGPATITNTGLSNYLYVTGGGGGNLTIDLTDDQDYANMIGRELTVFNQGAASVIVDITGGTVARAFRLTADTGDVATITTGGWAKFAFLNDAINCLIVGNAACTTA